MASQGPLISRRGTSQTLTKTSTIMNDVAQFAPRSKAVDVYASPSTLFVVATVGSGLFRVLFLERREADTLSEILYADPRLFDRVELDHILREPTRTTRERRQRAAEEREMEDTALKSSRQKPIMQFTAFGLLGVVRFLKGYYLLFLMERRRIGYVNGHAVYSVEKTRLVPVVPDASTSVSLSEDESDSGTRSRTWSWLGSNRDTHNELEGRYLSLFQLVDLTKGDFFLSYTLDLTNTLEGTFEKKSVDDAFVWNEYLTSELREAILVDEQRFVKRRKSNNNLPDPSSAQRLLWTTDSWLIPLIHGSFQQQRCTLFGKSITLTLLGRRSRFNAGTRYLKRGINEQGKVANHVEVEQILEVDGVSISSFVQVRGSIPTFWTQDTSAALPKPPIRQFRFDPTFSAARAHFHDLMSRYGAPIMVLNLVKQVEARPKESTLGKEYSDAVDLLNCSLPQKERITYDWLDFKKLSKAGVVGKVLEDVAKKYVDKIGVFFTDGAKWTFQDGAVRTNCIDGLDRTNVGQFCVGLSALTVQLNRSQVSLPVNATALGSLGGQVSGPFLDLFVDMFEALGDRIAQQYGGSQAHKKGGVAPTSELLTSIRRYYSNSFTDRAKQDAMNLFLGWFNPRKVHQEVLKTTLPKEAPTGPDGAASSGSSSSNIEPPKALWELETDYYLHNFHVTDSHQAFPPKLDTGTEIWWEGRHGEDEARRDMIAILSRMPRTSIIRPPAFDDESPGDPISFDRLAEPFFRPLVIDETSIDSQRRNPLRRLFKDKRSNESPSIDEDDETNTTLASVSRFGMGNLFPLGPLSIDSPFPESTVSEDPDGTLLVQDPDATEALLCPLSNAFLEPVKDFDFGVFMRAERIAHHASLAFEPQPIDQALVDYMSDFTVDIDDVEGNRRVIVDSNAVSSEIRTGELSGLRRGQCLSDLYAQNLSTAPILRLPTAESGDAAWGEEKQRALFLEYLALK